MKKILLIVMDGLGDRGCDDLRGLTPLQFVRNPNMDWFVEHGSAGICDPIAPGIRPEATPPIWPSSGTTSNQYTVEGDPSKR